MRFAKQFARELLQKHGIPATVEDLDAYDHECLATLDRTVAVGFIVSTFGEGDPPDNATGLFETMSRWKGAAEAHQQSLPLKGLHYFAFGLGSTKYQHFNGYVKTLDAQLLSLGAQRLGKVGMRDEADSHSDETTWLPWKTAVANELCRFEPTLVSEPVITSAMSMRTPDFVVEETAPRARLRGVMHAGEHNAEQSRGRIRLYAAPVAKSRLLSATSNDSGSSRTRAYLHVEFDLSGARPPLSYQTGDHVAVWPINNDNEVVLLQQAFGWSTAQMNAPIEIRPLDVNQQDATMPPSPTTRASLLRFYLDICGVVTRESLKLLASFTPTKTARQYIEALYADDQTYDVQVVKQHLTCGQIMAAATNVDPNGHEEASVWPQELFALFLQTLPPLQPRYFSIASSSRVSEKTVAITAGIVATPVPTTLVSTTQKQFYGLATNYLHALHERISTTASSAAGTSTRTNLPSYTLAGPRGTLAGNKALLQIRPSNFRMPADPTVPLILIAAGSGIAPFVGFMQERESQLTAGVAVGPTIMFFGCRSPDVDYLYAEEWVRLEQLESNRKDSQRFFSIYTAFSRSGPSKVYVQDRVHQEHQRVARLLQSQGAAVYICGSTTMAGEAKAALQKCLELAGMTQDSAQIFMQDLKKVKKLQEDVWA